MSLLLQMILGIILVKIVYLIIVPRRLRVVMAKGFDVVLIHTERQLNHLLGIKESTKDKALNSKKVVPIKRVK